MRCQTIACVSMLAAGLLASVAAAQNADTRKQAATSLLGKPLYAMELAPEAKETAEANLRAAREDAAKAPDSADAILWLGRSEAVAGHGRAAIAAFTPGIANFPSDTRFYRHRGHRYVSVREFDNAIADLELRCQRPAPTSRA